MHAVPKVVLVLVLVLVLILVGKVASIPKYMYSVVYRT